MLYILISKNIENIYLHGVFNSYEEAEAYKNSLPTHQIKYHQQDIYDQEELMRVIAKSSEKEIKEETDKMKAEREKINYAIISYQNKSKKLLEVV